MEEQYGNYEVDIEHHHHKSVQALMLEARREGFWEGFLFGVLGASVALLVGFVFVLGFVIEQMT